MESIWWNQEYINVESKINDSKKYDVIVIGAGMAGLLSAYYLQKSGFNVVVLEANQVGKGQSGKTTAKITSQHDLKYTQLVKKIGYKKAFLYAQSQEEAIDEYEELMREEKIDCDFKRVDSYLYSLKQEDCLWEEFKIAKKLGISACFTKRTELPFCVKGALRFSHQAMMNPVKFMKAIAEKLNIIEHCRVMKVKNHFVVSEKGEFYANKIIIATHFPILNVPGFYFMRQHQEKSYVFALKNSKNMEHMYYSIEQDGFSFRSYQDYLLVGIKGKRNYERNIEEKIQTFIKKYMPNASIASSWIAQDCMSHDTIPFIGKYSMWLKDVYVISGFSKWGMSTSMVAALLIKDLCLHRKNPYTPLYTPQRFYVSLGYKNAIKDSFFSMKELTKGWIMSANEKIHFLMKEEAKIVDIRGKKYACYKDREGKLHIINGQCSHMGCELMWNPKEKCWDCPCHGSSFTIDGEIIQEPAIKQVTNLDSNI